MKNIQRLVPVLFFVFLLAGCASGPYRQVYPVPPSQIRPKIERIAKLYLDPSATQEDLKKAYDEAYKAIQTSTYKKQIKEEILWPMRKNIDNIWWSGGILIAQDFMKGKKFSRSNPALVLVTPPVPYDSFYYFVDLVSLNMFKQLLGIRYVGYARYQFSIEEPSEYGKFVSSLKKTLRNSDIQKRNICFLIRRVVETSPRSITEETRQKIIEKLREEYQRGEITKSYYQKRLKQIKRAKQIVGFREQCTIQCSEEVNLLYSFQSPCWGKEVFEYLRENVYRSF